MPLLLGLDIGTTSVKAGVFDIEGHRLGFARHDYALQTPVVDHVELDAVTYWDATCAVIQQVLESNDIAGEDIGGIGVSSQGETIIPVDSAGNPIHPAIVWLDNRARDEAQQQLREALLLFGKPQPGQWNADVVIDNLVVVRENPPDHVRDGEYVLDRVDRDI